MSNHIEHTIQEFMTPQPCVVDEDLSLADAMDRMMANNIRHLVVVRDDVMIGIIDSSDLSLANAVMDEKLKDIPISRAVRGVFRCSPNMPLADVVRTMEGEHFGCVVVVDGNEVVGIFTLTDALRALRQLALDHPVQPETSSTHMPVPPHERENHAHHVRARRLLDSHHASPSANDGKVFGSVGV